MESVFETYILPISGTDFPKYMAYFSLIAETGVRPKIIYCASGGCLVANMAMMSGFTKAIEGWSVSSQMFVTKIPIPRILTLINRGYFYPRADISDYVSKKFVPSKLQDVEIVTGYYETSSKTHVRQKVTISTNQPRSVSVLKDFIPLVEDIKICFAEEKPQVSLEQDVLVGRETKEYLDKLMLKTIRTIQYTTNIPIISEPLDDIAALDFGIVATSPRATVGAELKKTIYFSPVDIETRRDPSLYNMFFQSYVMEDINNICSKYSHKKSFTAFPEVLKFLSANKNLQDYCLIIFSTNKIDMPVDNFSIDDTKKEMLLSKECTKFTLFY